MKKGWAIAIAWPQTWCKRTGAWYDHLTDLIGIQKEGYYLVGHSAVVLIDADSGHCAYYDFGRYHAPPGFGRVRSAHTDHELAIDLRAIVSEDKTCVLNLEEILETVALNPSNHGTGDLFAAVCPVNFTRAMIKVAETQSKIFEPYGPFIRNGNNCSRFVSSVLLESALDKNTRWKLRLPLTLSPSPMSIVRSVSSQIHCVGLQERRMKSSSEIKTLIRSA